MNTPLLPWLHQLLRLPIEIDNTAVFDVLQGQFPSMSKRDVARLLQLSQSRTLAMDEALYDSGASRRRLYCILEGELVEHVREGDLRRLRSPSLVGEAAWLLKTPFPASAPVLVARQRTDVVFWDYECLDTFVKTSPALRSSLVDGMAKSLACPGELMDTSLTKNIRFSPDLKQLHNIAFPSLSEEQFSQLLFQSEASTEKAGSILDTRMKIAVITQGTVRISRADGHYLDLGVGSFLGELGWAAPDRCGKEYVVVKTTEEVTLLRWSFERLSQLQKNSPRLYAGVLHGVARDVAVKLSLPMQKCRVMEEAKAMSA